MKRRHLFEWEDQDWFPHIFRNYMTDFLRHVILPYKLYEPVIGRIMEAMERSGCDRIVDLCSGSAGPLEQISASLSERGRPVSVLLTDKFPNSRAWRNNIQPGSGIEFMESPVDATAVPEELRGFRTIFSAFHHFRPEQARAILRDAAESGQPIGVFEITERRKRILIQSLVAVPLAVLLTTPSIRPFRWGRLFWTYLIPVVPLATVWDGLVSCIRTYTPDELQELCKGLGQGRYRWQAGQVPFPVGNQSITYLIGTPQVQPKESGQEGGDAIQPQPMEDERPSPAAPEKETRDV